MAIFCHLQRTIQTLLVPNPYSYLPMTMRLADKGDRWLVDKMHLLNASSTDVIENLGTLMLFLLSLFAFFRAVFT